LLQRHGKDVVALVSMKELKIVEKIDEMEDKVDLKEALKILQKIKSGQTDTISLEEAKQELGL
jgi:predicted DNA-binding protein